MKSKDCLMITEEPYVAEVYNSFSRKGLRQAMPIRIAFAVLALLWLAIFSPHFFSFYLIAFAIFISASGILWGLLLRAYHYRPWQTYALTTLDSILLTAMLFYSDSTNLPPDHALLYFSLPLIFAVLSYRVEAVALSTVLGLLLWSVAGGGFNQGAGYALLFAFLGCGLSVGLWYLRYIMSRQLLAEQEYYSLLATQKSDPETHIKDEDIEYIDRLTGLGTRAAFDRDSALFTNIFAEGRLKDLTIAFIDIEDPKGLIQTYGQQEYKRMLHSFAVAARKRFRSSDMIYRFSSDQFVLLAPGSTVSNLDRLRDILVKTSDDVVNDGFTGFKATMGTSTLGEVQAQNALAGEAA
jgi:diguanylate cyclase (GGDEF)-like protein